MIKVGRLIKENLSAFIKDGMGKHGNTFLVSYSKVSSSRMNDLRKSLKKVGAKLFTSKNRVAQKALDELKLQDLSKKIEGQTAFVWSNSDSSDVSKALMTFTKTCQGLVIKGGLLEGRILDKDDVKRLSDLPSRHVLLTMLAGTIQAPLTRLASALNAETYDLLNLLKQLSEKKGGNQNG